MASVHGRHLIGTSTSRDGSESFTAIDPRATGEALAPAFAEATPGEIMAAMELAAAAHPGLELAGRERRAAFLEATAEAIEGLGDDIPVSAFPDDGMASIALHGSGPKRLGGLRREELREQHCGIVL